MKLLQTQYLLLMATLVACIGLLGCTESKSGTKSVDKEEANIAIARAPRIGIAVDKSVLKNILNKTYRDLNNQLTPELEMNSQPGQDTLKPVFGVVFKIDKDRKPEDDPVSIYGVFYLPDSTLKVFRVDSTRRFNNQINLNDLNPIKNRIVTEFEFEDNIDDQAKSVESFSFAMFHRQQLELMLDSLFSTSEQVLLGGIEIKFTNIAGRELDTDLFTFKLEQFPSMKPSFKPFSTNGEDVGLPAIEIGVPCPPHWHTSGPNQAKYNFWKTLQDSIDSENSPIIAL